MLSAAQMLEHLGAGEAASAIRGAIASALGEGRVTVGANGSVHGGAAVMAAAVIAQLA
jgi:isocitrate/isopropylmalate dehydrogenase